MLQIKERGSLDFGMPSEQRHSFSINTVNLRGIMLLFLRLTFESCLKMPMLAHNTDFTACCKLLRPVHAFIK